MNRFSFVFNAYTIHIKHDCIRYIRYSHIVIFRQMRQIEIHRTIHTSDKCNVSILFSIHKHTNIIQYIHTHTQNSTIRCLTVWFVPLESLFVYVCGVRGWKHVLFCLKLVIFSSMHVHLCSPTFSKLQELF